MSNSQKGASKTYMRFLKVCFNFAPLCEIWPILCFIHHHKSSYKITFCCFSNSLYYFNANLLTEKMFPRYQASTSRLVNPFHDSSLNRSYTHSRYQFINDKLQFHDLIMTNDPLTLKTIKGY